MDTRLVRAISHLVGLTRRAAFVLVRSNHARCTGSFLALLQTLL
jgi:hypothetical protein